jgi:hypothetical protein
MYSVSEWVEIGIRFLDMADLNDQLAPRLCRGFQSLSLLERFCERFLHYDVVIPFQATQRQFIMLGSGCANADCLHVLKQGVDIPEIRDLVLSGNFLASLGIHITHADKPGVSNIRINAAVVLSHPAVPITPILTCSMIHPVYPWRYIMTAITKKMAG